MAHTCDICEREVATLSASRRGRWGLDLCHACWQRLRSEERRRELSIPVQAQAIRGEGPPWSWPLCEFCGEDVNQHDLGYYTTKGQRRRFCCIVCRQTRNSRVGAPIRSVLAKRRVRAGQWENPAIYHTPESLKAAAEAGAAARTQQHREALEAGTWQNPADAPGAREKLSRPRVHADNPLLHRAIERIQQGARVTDLASEEAEAYRAYRRERQKRLSERPPNNRLREARLQAGLSQAALARQLGVASNTVGNWERNSAIPQHATRAAAIEILGCDPWEK